MFGESFYLPDDWLIDPFDSLIYGSPQVALLCTVLSAMGLTWLLARQWSGPRGFVTTCGHCGYDASGLHSLTCPECGSDFRLVGLVSPFQRAALRPLPFALWWTILLPFPTVLLLGVLAQLGPQDQTPMLTCEAVLPEELKLAPLNLMLQGVQPLGRDGKPRYDNLTLYVEVAGGGYAQLDHLLHQSAPELTVNGQPFKTEATGVTGQLQAWLVASAGAKSADAARYEASAAALAGLLEQVQNRRELPNSWPGLTFQNLNPWTNDQPARWFMKLMLGLAAGGWLAGLIWQRWHWRRRQAQMRRLQRLLQEMTQRAAQTSGGKVQEQ